MSWILYLQPAGSTLLLIAAVISVNCKDATCVNAYRSDGKVAFSVEVDTAKPFAEGLSAYRKGGLWGYMDTFGRPKIAPKYESACSFSEGLACVKGEKGWNFIDTAGEVAIGGEFAHAGDFSEGLAAVSTSGKYGYINKTGTYVVEPIFKTASRFSEGYACVELEEGYGFVNQRGVPLGAIPFAFESCRDFRFGRAAVMKAGKWTYIDTAGATVWDAQLQFAGDFGSDGLAPVNADGHFQYTDRAGNPTMTELFTSGYEFRNGRALIFRGSDCGVAMVGGSILIEPAYVDCRKSDSGLFVGRLPGWRLGLPIWKLFNKEGGYLAVLEASHVGDFGDADLLLTVGDCNEVAESSRGP